MAEKANVCLLFFLGQCRFLLCLLDLNLSLQSGLFFALLFIFPLLLFVLYLSVIPLDELQQLVNVPVVLLLTSFCFIERSWLLFCFVLMDF
jgi:hypothetical protein